MPKNHANIHRTELSIKKKLEVLKFRYIAFKSANVIYLNWLGRRKKGHRFKHTDCLIIIIMITY